MESVYRVLFFLVSQTYEWEDDYWDILIEGDLCYEVSLYTLIAAISISFIFYVVIGRLTTSFQTTLHWAIFAVLAGLVGFLIALSNVKSKIYIDVEIEQFGYLFSLSNVIWPILYFITSSFIFKYLSLYARRTPF